MKSIVFCIFMLCSIIWFLAWCFCIYRRCKRYPNKKVPILILITAGFFISTWLFLIPACFLSYDYGVGHYYLRPLLFSLLCAIKIFILESDYDFVVRAASDLPDYLRISYTLYGAFVLVAAPMLTFSNVLYFFKSFGNELKFSRSKNKSVYIMSEVNAQSVTLAKSIAQKDTGRKKPVIVFANVSEQTEEKFDLFSEIEALGAICLKKSVLNLDLINKKSNVEIFLIGEDESDNVSMASALTQELNNAFKIPEMKIFVFAKSETSTYVLDSLHYENLLKEAFKNASDDYKFKLRRIDCVQQLVWNEVPKMNIIQNASDKLISILIVGIGNYGMTFFKMLVWYCQAYGYRLEINIVAKEGTLGDDTIESKIRRNCPELLDYCTQHKERDMNYSVRCFSGIDLNTNSFREMMEYSGPDADKTKIAERFRNVGTIIVATGDDNTNIETAVYLRTLYDKMHHKYEWKKSKPQIYAIVYDDNKCFDDKDSYLMNHDGISYDIHFIGNFSMQYSYENIYDAELEKSALMTHNKWVQVKMDENGAIATEGRTEEQIREDEERLNQNIQKFERFEYFRLSSMASGIHKKAMEECFPNEEESGDFRQCSEHMRWNAYMMVDGYEYHEVRNNRAKMHPNIKPRNRLNDKEKKKD